MIMTILGMIYHWTTSCHLVLLTTTIIIVIQKGLTLKDLKWLWHNNEDDAQPFEHGLSRTLIQYFNMSKAFGLF